MIPRTPEPEEPRDEGSIRFTMQLNNTPSTPHTDGRRLIPGPSGNPSSLPRWGFSCEGLKTALALGLLWLIAGCELGVEGDLAVGVERGHSNDLHRTDVNADGKVNVELPGG